MNQPRRTAHSRPDRSTTPRRSYSGGYSRPTHLLSENRHDYERVLDEALRSALYRPELAAVGQRLNPEQLRTMALNATALITAAAATEYQHYVRMREELRQSASSARSARRGRNFNESGRQVMGSATTMGEPAEPAGAGAVTVAAVLAPVLFGAGAVLFALVGYVLRTFDPESSLARTVITTGWVFGAVTGVALLVATVGLLLAALRNRASAQQVSAKQRTGREGGPGQGGLARGAAAARHPAVPARRPRGPGHGGSPPRDRARTLGAHAPSRLRPPGFRRPRERSRGGAQPQLLESGLRRAGAERVGCLTGVSEPIRRSAALRIGLSVQTCRCYIRCGQSA